MEELLSPDALTRAYQDDIKQGFSANRYEAELRSVLQRLSVQSRIVFAVLCAEQSYLYYKDYANRYQPKGARVAAEIIDRIWQHLLGVLISESEIEQYGSFLESLSFDEPSPDYEGITGPAIEAVSSICSALLACRDHSVDSAVAAAFASVYAIDKMLMRREVGISYVSQSPSEMMEVQLRVAHDPLMVRELMKQAEVLRYLQVHRELTENDITDRCANKVKHFLTSLITTL